jgi:hypothetical protein
MVIAGTVVQEQPLFSCRGCGKPYARRQQGDQLLQRLPLVTAVRGLCPVRARIRSAHLFAGPS